MECFGRYVFLTQALQPPLAQPASALSLTLPVDGGDSEKCPRILKVSLFSWDIHKQRLIPTCSGPVDEKLNLPQKFQLMTKVNRTRKHKPCGIV